MTTTYAPDLSDQIGSPARRRSGRALGRRLVRGREGDGPWIRPALLVLLAGTGVLYLCALSASGWGNSFYAAAAQAGSQSWKAFFYGSSDAANAITVDKPPASLWLMALSVRAFGLSSWSVLLPQALEGIASVGLLYATVRRVFSPAAGLIAGAVLALTPVAVLIFRFDNPDSLLVLCMIGAAYATTRAIETPRARWFILTGVLLGFGFLTKTLQVLTVFPGLALAYAIAAPVSRRKRLGHLGIATGAFVVAAGWWVAIVELVPASMRPYIGGSQHNSELELIFGYNGFGRITGDETGSVTGGGGGGGFGGAAGGGAFGRGRGSAWGETGLLRMFNGEIGGQVSWLIPAALLLGVAGLWWTRRAPRTDHVRAALIVWGGWLVVTMAVFSFMAGIFHPYYTVALAPAIGALVGIGATLLWRYRTYWFPRLTLAAALIVTAVWAFRLLDRTPQWHPWLRWLVLVVGIATALGLVASHRLTRRVGVAVAAIAVAAGIAGPAAYATSTAAQAHTGSIPSAGPSGAGFGMGGFGRGGAGGRGPGGGRFGGNGGNGGTGTGGTGGRWNGGPPSTGSQNGTGAQGGTGTQGGLAGRIGGLLDGSTPSAAITAALRQGASSYTWVAAAVGSNSAAGYQLASGRPVMAVGGFNGSDPSPTLAQFQAYVSAGKIHYFIGGGGFGGQNGGSNSSSAISSWVSSNYTATTIGGVTVYDLTQPGGATA